MRHGMLVAAIMIPMVATFGCDDEDGDVTGVVQDPVTVRFVNATTNAGSVDFSVDGSGLANGLGSGQTSACLEVDAGAATLAYGNGGSAALATVDQTLTAGATYTVVATGTMEEPEIMVLAETGAPAAGQSRLRVVNTSPTTTTFDVYATGPNDELTTPTQSNVMLGATPTYVEVPAGQTRVRLTAAGTTTTLLDTGAFNLTTGQSRTLIVSDQPTGGVLQFTSFDAC